MITGHVRRRMNCMVMQMYRVTALAVLMASIPVSVSAAQAGESSATVIELHPVTRLVDPAGRCGLGGRVGIVTRRDDGHVFTIDSYSGTRIAEYDERGECVRTLGREGEGPGEYVSIEALELWSSPDLVDTAILM